MRKTAWEKRGIVEQNQHIDPNESSGVPVIDALSTYDVTRWGLYSVLRTAAAKNARISEYHEEAAELINDTADAFSELVSTVRESSEDIDAEKDQIKKLWKLDDNERVDLFLDLVTTDRFKKFEDKDADKIIDNLYLNSEYDTLTDNIQEMYRYGLAADVQILAEMVQARAEENSEIIDREIIITVHTGELKKHVLDIAKIAIGTGLVVFAAKKFFEK